MKDHNGGDERCFLLKAEGAYYKGYWIYFSVPADAALSAADSFLRRIWCECCGHLSAFRLDDEWYDEDEDDFGMSRKLSSFLIGDKLPYEYDFGTTTDIIVTIVGECSRPAQREEAQLLARNVPPRDICAKCGAPATQLDVFEGETFCDKCAESLDEETPSLPITNSPRCGQCGYDGELDRWTFDPAGPFPQPAPMPVKRRRGSRVSTKK